MEDRLQKLIAHAGVCSRREAEDLITGGLVTVNGEVVKELGSKADPTKDHIKVNGKLLQFDKDFTYVLMYKPKGVVSTVSDPEGRPVVTDLIKGVKTRLYPVGRLDINTEGALLLTNDGELTTRLLAARSNCPKTYLVKVTGVPDAKALARVERGVTIDGTHYGSCRTRVLKVVGKNTWIMIELTQGKNHQVKNVMAHVGHPVAKLKRIAFAALTTEGLEPGQWRTLTVDEIQALKTKRYYLGSKFDPYVFLKEVGVAVSPGDRRKISLFYPDRPEGARPPERGPRGRRPAPRGRGSGLRRGGRDSDQRGDRRGNDRERRFDRDDSRRDGERRFDRKDSRGERRFDRGDSRRDGEGRYERKDDRRDRDGGRRFDRGDSRRDGERRFDRGDSRRDGERRFERKASRGERDGGRRFDRKDDRRDRANHQRDGERRFDRDDSRRDRDNRGRDSERRFERKDDRRERSSRRERPGGASRDGRGDGSNDAFRKTGQRSGKRTTSRDGSSGKSFGSRPPKGRGRPGRPAGSKASRKLATGRPKGKKGVK